LAEVPWDVKLLRAGKSMEKVEGSTGAHRQRETSVYRMLRDAYIDTESQDQMVHAVDTILKDVSAPESLRDAARLLQKEVRAQHLPAPEALLKRKAQMREQHMLQQQVGREQRASQVEAGRVSPLERVFKDVKPVVEDRGFQKDFVKERAAAIEGELGMDERDVLRLHKAMETFNYHANRLHPDLRTKLPFTWKDFLSAEPHETTDPPKGLFGRIKFRVKEQFSPRRKMLRQFKREMKRLPSHKRKTFEMLIGDEVTKLIGL
ncbi:MAG: hypothetical protein P8J32_02075, partial [bacterium]|nr:hypothetical protein [bacterium]